MPAFDPIRLAEMQLARDKERTARFPALLARKVARMSVSPLAFLRGAAPLFYDVLRARPQLAKGPPGEGWITGDLHLENFGAYRPEPRAREKDPVEFYLNDFDEAVRGPWRLEVLRVTTSLILAGRELGADGPRALALCAQFLDAYAARTVAGPGLPAMPKPVAALVEKVRSRPQKALLEGRTELVKGKLRLVRGARYFDLPRELADAVPHALEEYALSRPPEERPKPEQLELIDCAFRVAGTGSLGALRVAALVRGKGGDTGSWIFDIKEEGAPSAEALVAVPPEKPAERVLSAILACVPRPPRMVGTTTLAGLSMLVRRLSPQEDKLDLTRLREGELDDLAGYLGALTASAHVRAATVPLTKAWTHADREQLIDGAITMAGIHEAAYLAWCRITR